MASPLRKKTLLMGMSDVLSAAVFKDYPAIVNVDLWGYKELMHWDRKYMGHTMDIENGPDRVKVGEPSIHGLDVSGTLSKGGVVIVFEMENGDEIDFTVELTDEHNPGVQMVKSVNTSNRDAAFQTLETALEETVRTWASKLPL
jgi:hypothetical protein